MGIPVRINGLCENVGVEIYSAGLYDSQILNLDPQRSGRRCRGGCGVLGGGGVLVPLSNITSHWQRAICRVTLLLN